MARLFTAVALPDPVRADLTALAVGLDGVHWTPPENLHLTLRFIGEAPADKQNAMALALARVRVEPFILPVAGIGVFPSRGDPKVLWAGLGHAHTRLFQLRKQIDEALLAADPALDVHRFHPHITLGRISAAQNPRPLAKFLAHHAAFEAPPFRVSEFHLLSSESEPGRPPAYRIMHTFALHAKA